MPKMVTICEHCGKEARYIRSQTSPSAEADPRFLRRALPFLFPGNLHVYRCAACKHLTKVAA